MEPFKAIVKELALWGFKFGTIQPDAFDSEYDPMDVIWHHGIRVGHHRMPIGIWYSKSGNSTILAARNCNDTKKYFDIANPSFNVVKLVTFLKRGKPPELKIRKPRERRANF